MRTTLAENLVYHRELRGWTQYDLAVAAKMSVEGLRGYEQKKRWPDPEVLESLATALGIEPAHLLGMAPKPTPEQAIEVLTELVRQKRADSVVQPAPTTLADALSAALVDDEFEKVATFLKALTGGRLDLSQSPKMAKPTHKSQKPG